MNFDVCTLLITGCISPGSGIPTLKLIDEEERKKQYLSSIRYYIENSCFDKIVYCDNSNPIVETEILECANKNKKQFEWINFSGNQETVIEQGKGYGEGEIINYALGRSELLRNSSYMVKVTGRLKIKNINFLTRVARPKRIYFQPNATEDKRKYINTRVYMMPILCYEKYFKFAYQEVDDKKGIYIEHIFGSIMEQNKIDYNRFLVVPDYCGMSGSTGAIYDQTAWGLLKETIKMYMVKS